MSAGPAITASSWYRRRTAGYPHHHCYQRITQQWCSFSNWWRTSSASGLTGVLSVQIDNRDNRARTNNILEKVESYHSGLRLSFQVSHSNLFNFLTHLRIVTVDKTADFADDDDDNDGVNVDEQQQQQQQHSGPATWATAAADATSAPSATCEVCLPVRHFLVLIFRSCIFSRPTQTIQRRWKLIRVLFSKISTRSSATAEVSKFVLCFTRYGS